MSLTAAQILDLAPADPWPVRGPGHQGAENCLLLDQEGFVTEGPGFNVFVVRGGAVERPGPISARLREAFWAKRADGWHATPIDYGPEA